MMNSADSPLENLVASDGLSVIVPAYNETRAAADVVKSLAKCLGALGLSFEVLVVDDGSTDGTSQSLQGMQCRVIRHAHNLGYGAALKTGIRHAKHELLCIIDSDGTYPVEAIPKLLASFDEGGVDMVVGARIGPRAHIPLLRRPAKWALGRIADMVVGRHIDDINSGLRLFGRTLAIRLFGLLPDGFSFTTTITLAMLSSGYNVKYVPIDYIARIGRSKIRPIRDTLNFFILILRIALYFYPLKLFLPASIILLIAGIAWGVFSKILFGTVADISTVLIVMTAIQIAAVGLLAELINHRIPNEYRQE